MKKRKKGIQISSDSSTAKDPLSLFNDPEIEQLLSVLKQSEDLNCLEMDEITKKVLTKIPREEIISFVAFNRFYKEIYRVIRESCFEINLPKKELKAINKALKLLKTKGWLSGQGISEVNKKVEEQMAKSEKGAQYAAAKMIKSTIKTGGREKTDPLVVGMILIFLNIIKIRTNRFDYQMAADFLSAQGLIEGMTDDAIRKIHKRNKLCDCTTYYKTIWHAATIRFKNELSENIFRQDYEELYHKFIISSIDLK